MYITWRREKLTDRWLNAKTGRVTKYGSERGDDRCIRREQMTAYLSEGTRVDGMPRRRVVAKLGHIEAARVGCVPDQAVFWYQAEAGLATAGLAEGERERFTAALAAIVSPPDLGVLASSAEWNDLVLQSIDAAAALLPSIPLDDTERAKRQGTIDQLRAFYASRRRIGSWLEARRQDQQRKHDRELLAVIEATA